MRIRFSEGYYETEDKEEIRLLKRDGHVVEVSAKDYEPLRDVIDVEAPLPEGWE